MFGPVQKQLYTPIDSGATLLHRIASLRQKAVDARKHIAQQDARIDAAGMDGAVASGSGDLEAGTPLQSAAVVSVRQLVKAYGATQALQGISFEAQAGQITVLLGHNGAGKSTLVQILCGEGATPKAVDVDGIFRQMDIVMKA